MTARRGVGLLHDVDITAVTGASACGAITLGARKVASRRDAAHKVGVRIEGGTCVRSERTDSGTVVTGTRNTTVEEPYSVSTGRTCVETKVDSTCITGNGRGCATTSICADGGSETRYRSKEVEVEIRAPYTHRIATLTMTGTFVIEWNGKVTRQPFTLTASSSEDRTGRTGFAKDAPVDVATWATLETDLAPAKVTEAITALAEPIQAASRERYVQSALTKLAANDREGATNDLLIASLRSSALVVPATNTALDELAADVDLPPQVWRKAIETGTLEPPPVPSNSLPRGLAARIAWPTGDSVLEEASTRAYLEDRAAEDRDLEDNHRSSVLGVGILQWHDASDDNRHGLEVLVAGGKINGMSRYWFREHALTLGLSSGPAVGHEGLFRGGVGLRSKWLGAALHAVGATARRGGSDTDVGLPLGLELGAGARIVIGAIGDRRLEVILDRIVRPLSEEAMPAEVRGRIRYELRYLSEKDEFDVGARLWCSFEQTTASDLVTPSGPTSARSCTVAAFLKY
ncbi:MAG: hypothetical protein SFX73_04585 [Kofleriaceae bacterium]|nr:hypothetical protein [Kofleriaceae bacterium]